MWPDPRPFGLPGGAASCACGVSDDALPSRRVGLHRDVLDQLPCCFIKLEASGDGLRSAIQYSQSLVEGPANHAFHCKERNALGVVLLT